MYRSRLFAKLVTNKHMTRLVDNHVSLKTKYQPNNKMMITSECQTLPPLPLYRQKMQSSFSARNVNLGIIFNFFKFFKNLKQSFSNLNKRLIKYLNKFIFIF